MAKALAEKLLIKPNTSLWLSDSARMELLQPLPEGVVLVTNPGKASTAVIFADDAASLKTTLEALQDGLNRPAAFWVAYPKANRTDINRDSIWPLLSSYGLRPVTQIAVDEVWSALRFRALKPGEKAFTGGR